MNYIRKNKFIFLVLFSLFISLNNLNASTINISGIIDSTVAANIESELAIEDVTVLSDGNISIDANITWSSQSILRLQTDNNTNIYVNASIENTNKITGGVLFKASNIVVFDSNGLVKINNINQMNLISTVASSTTGRYELASDINASDTHTWNSGKGFIPIKTFRGNFDGKNHTIDGLYINDIMLAQGGLFSSLYYANIQNLGLTNVYIRGRIIIGALSGKANNTSITNVYSSGSVIAERYVGSHYPGASQVGGLVGYFVLNSSLSYSYSTASVTAIGLSEATTEKIGGLVGEEYGTTRIEHCYSNNIVTAMDHDGNLLGLSVGGLLGYSSGGLVDDSYALGSVSGSRFVGGLVGTANDSNITNNYSSASATGTGVYSHGALIGARYVSGNYSRVYSNFVYGKVTGLSGGVFGDTGGILVADGLNGFDIDTVTITVDAGGGLPLYSSNAASANISIFDTATIASYWDFSNVWFSIQDYTRPILRSRHSLIIKDAQQLQLMSMDLTADYVLGADIDLSDSKSNNSGMWNTLYGFVPIGDANTPFTGSFDGQGYTISNLFIDHNTTEDVGFFGVTKNAIIKNINFVNADVKGEKATTGILVGTADMGTDVSEVSVRGKITGNTKVGGLIGLMSQASVDNSYSLADVNGSDSVGGLIGSLSVGIVSHSYAAGLVIGSTNVGGLLGTSGLGGATSSFWDVNTSTQTTSASTAQGLSTAELQMSTTFLAGDWDILDGSGNYPTLNSMANSVWLIASPSVLSGLSDITKEEDFEAFDISFNETDIDGNLIIYTVSSPDTTKATLSVVGNILTIEPIANANGNVVITLNASQSGGVETQVFTLSITPLSDVIALGVLSDVNGLEDSAPFDINLDITNVDGYSITFSAISADTTLATVYMVGNTLSVTPQVNANGTSLISVTATANGVDVVQTFTLTLSAVDDLLTLSPLSDFTKEQDFAPFSVELNAYDIDGDTITYSALSSDTTIASVSLSGSTLNVTSQSGKYGEVEISVSATANNVEAIQVFTLTINAQVITISEETTTTEDENATIYTLVTTDGITKVTLYDDAQTVSEVNTSGVVTSFTTDLNISSTIISEDGGVNFILSLQDETNITTKLNFKITADGRIEYMLTNDDIQTSLESNITGSISTLNINATLTNEVLKGKFGVKVEIHNDGTLSIYIMQDGVTFVPYLTNLKSEAIINIVETEDKIQVRTIINLTETLEF